MLQPDEDGNVPQLDPNEVKPDDVVVLDEDMAHIMASLAIVSTQNGMLARRQMEAMRNAWGSGRGDDAMGQSGLTGTPVQRHGKNWKG